MKRKSRDTAALEAELLHLNKLVRQRREQLARLEHCPHKDCECRQVWQEVVEGKLANQVHKVRSHVRVKRKPSAHSRKTARPKP